MAKDWEKLAGEKGERVASGRLERMVRLGRMGVGVGLSSLAGKMKSVVRGESGDDALEALYRQNAGRMAEVLGQLKGASMKIGQMLSADPEALPPEFAEGLAVLQRNAPPMTWNTVKAQIEGALDRPLESVFSRFDPDPVGAASIGQVHRARLDTGEEVAVKVQYPGVSEALDSDMETLRSMLVWGRPFFDRERLDRYFGEIRETLRAEADYTREAEALARFGEHLADRPGFRVPRPFPELTRPQVLVMEFVEGEKLDDALEAMEDQAAREELLERWVSLYVWMFHELFELHADPHPGNFLVDADGQMVLLDFGCVKRFEPEFADGMLALLDTLWEDDHARALDIYEELGFGGPGFDPHVIDPEFVRGYHEIVLGPFLRDERFEFGGWQPALEGKRFMLRHPSMLQLTPPPEALLYFRVLSGIKGLLGRFDAKINTHPIAVETAIRRGVRTGA